MDVAKPARRLKGSVVTRLRRATERRGADGSRRSSAPLLCGAVAACTAGIQREPSAEMMIAGTKGMASAKKVRV